MATALDTRQADRADLCPDLVRVLVDRAPALSDEQREQIRAQIQLARRERSQPT